ncbi:rRNA maturation RNase YbeY [Colwellia sp. MT41]|uniref:Endoribonuclease YbeY n=1 Tax=Colwellia marinimaniae TaxID=1513592 RepID=A0ABQ0MSE9_9GAMM|nr:MULTISPECIES: rRNA maturation RNase YbeY [Colwellia]ALO35399.1 rRNA maturation RNase YbeY [Colwellia sp. MT41]GAW95300.1 endoribonuclease YbeY [Colwellia marinimaniae]
MAHVIDLQIACKATELPTKAQFQLWVDTALAEVTSKPEQEFELTIRLVNSDESQQLNSQYRGQDKATNVLSFPFEVPDGIELNLLGDLIICIEVMKLEAQAQNKALFDHWAHLVIHGCLHLVGFDHISDSDAVEMETIEIAILAKLGISNPY